MILCILELLNALAKRLRSQYPGSVDFIDGSDIIKFSGVDPANAFYQNLLQDINRGLANTKNRNMIRLLL